MKGDKIGVSACTLICLPAKRVRQVLNKTQNHLAKGNRLDRHVSLHMLNKILQEM